MSLKATDDERTEISKKISWILRHGAKKVSVDIDADGWVKVSDLLSSDILNTMEVSEDKLMSVVNASNELKVKNAGVARYEIGEAEDGGKQIRAINKHTMSGMAKSSDRPRRVREDREPREGRDGADEGGGYSERPRGKADRGGKGFGKARDGDQADGPTFEQQVRDGFLPVYQGDKVVAMVRKSETVKPGRRENEPRGKGKIDQDTRLRWRVCPTQQAIVRTGEVMDSETIGTLPAGTLVVQTSEEKVLKHGIVRMQVETVEPFEDAPDGVLRGWVTKTAERAGGPAFFQLANGDGRTGGGKGKSDGGKGRDGKVGGKSRGFGKSGYADGKGKGKKGGVPRSCSPSDDER